MNSKTLLLCSAILISFTAATTAQTNNWEVYNADNSQLTNNSVLAVETVGKTAWIGTTEGLNYFNGIQWTILTTENSGLPGDHINDIAREDNGALWVATDNGLAKLYDHTWTIYNMSNSDLPVDVIKCITIDDNNNKWIGTWGGGLVKFNGSTWTVYNTSNSQIPSNGINCITANSNGAIWAGTFSNGIGVLNNNTWTVYNTDNSGLQSNEIRSVAFDTNGNTWIGLVNGIVKVINNNWIYINHSITGFPFQSVNNITCGSKVWFATDNGVIEYDGAHWISHRADNSSLPVNDVRAIDIDENMNLWMGTAGGGLAIYNENGVALSVEDAEAVATALNVFPNPSNGEVTLSFISTHQGNAEVALYDVQGRKISTVLNEEVNSGKHAIKYDTNSLPAGVYIWWIKLEDRTDTIRLAVL